MNNLTRVEETLNGLGYQIVYNEVVVSDGYRLKQLNFVPDVIFDLGANVGVFTRYARQLFPNALIVAVEPDDDNFENLLKFTQEDEKLVFIKAAISVNPVYKTLNEPNGSLQKYLSNGLGYQDMENDARAIPHEVELTMPSDLYSHFVKDGQKFIFKIDIEGNEHAIFTHEPSMNVLRMADYICAEVHFFAQKTELLEEVRQQSIAALESLNQTHNCELKDYAFWATKK